MFSTEIYDCIDRLRMEAIDLSIAAKKINYVNGHTDLYLQICTTSQHLEAIAEKIVGELHKKLDEDFKQTLEQSSLIMKTAMAVLGWKAENAIDTAAPS